MSIFHMEVYQLVVLDILNQSIYYLALSALIYIENIEESRRAENPREKGGAEKAIWLYQKAQAQDKY